MSQEEQNKQDQQPGLSRLDQERRDLSASVEETLESVQGQDWDEEDEDVEDSMSTTAPRPALFPPRLSLQSKSMPAVRETEDAASADALLQQQAEEVHHATTWTRITHRLASAFGLGTRSGALPDLPPPSPDEEQQLSRQRENSLLPLNPLEGPEKPASPAAGAVLHDETTQRLGGHRPKVRLQTAAIPAVSGRERDTRKEQAVHHATPSAISAPSDHKDTGKVSVLGAVPHREAITEEHTPVRKRPARTSVELCTAFGNGAFEEGQVDVFIEESLVTERSVVMVTLTNNPGRVVMQYTSLYSHLGFTI
ncbi:MAG TPA: hypothetical protein VH593_19305, partial [Ktedonobacteraceae bacterium]